MVCTLRPYRLRLPALGLAVVSVDDDLAVWRFHTSGVSRRDHRVVSSLLLADYSAQFGSSMDV
jgi:hypothetical protein